MNSLLSNSFVIASSPTALGVQTSDGTQSDYGKRWRKIALESVEARKKCLNWCMALGLATMLAVSTAGWAATGMVISRLLR